MGNVVIDTSMSPDGYIPAPNDNPEQGRARREALSMPSLTNWRHMEAEPAMKNAAVAKLEALVGTWDLTMTDAWFLDSPETEVHGTATIEWLGEAFLQLRSTWDDESTFDWVIGRSDPHELLTVLYHDDRGVCRVFRMTLEDGDWLMERADPDFHQRIVGTVSANRIDARTEASEDEGRTWRKDFDLIFERRPERVAPGDTP